MLLFEEGSAGKIKTVPLDAKQLPDNVEVLRQMLVDLAAQLDKEQAQRTRIEHLLQQLLRAKCGPKSEQLSAEQLALFGTQPPPIPDNAQSDKDQDHPGDDDPVTGGQSAGRSGGRRPLSKNLKRERVEHDLPESEKHCAECHQDLRAIGEEVSERYEYVPASVTVIEDVCRKYACQCTVKTAGKPSQPIEKSTAGASLLAQVIVAKYADHQPLNRQEKQFARFGVDLSRKTMCGWMAQSAQLLDPLYEELKRFVLRSKVVQTDDTPVKVQDRKLPKTRTGRIWPYVGDANHQAVVYDYTATRERAGPEEFLRGYRGYLQADAYVAYDSFFTNTERGLVEVGCWAHARRHFFEALETDRSRMGTVLGYVARMYAVEKIGRQQGMKGEQRRLLREQGARPLLNELHEYLLRISQELLPKSVAGQAVAYALKNWAALTRYLEDGDLSIDNNAAERSLRGIAVGRNNWTFFGSDNGGKTAAVLRSFVMSCERVKVEPWAWFHDVLTRISDHPITKLGELLPHCWTPSPAL